MAQMALTSLALVALTIGLLSFLPDFATFDGESDGVSQMVKAQPQPESQLLFSSELTLLKMLNENRLFWQKTFFLDGGPSRVHIDYTVGQLMRESSTISLILVFLSFLLSVFAGAVLGVVSGWTYGQRIDKFIQFIGSLITSMPSFLLAPILIYLLAVKWTWFPIALWQGPQSLVLPVLTLSLRPSFYLGRLLAEQIQETLKADFIKVARAKGVAPTQLWRFHVLPNSFSLFVGAVGSLLGQLFSGLFLVEALFALPGLGFLFVRSLGERDYPLFISLVLFFSLMMQVGHRGADFMLLLLNPAMNRNSKQKL